MPSETLQEELEALQAIFLEEIKIGDEQANGETTVSMVLYPSTGDDQNSKFVTLTLELTLPVDYPKSSPIIRLRNPRGLSETMLDSLYRTMQQSCTSQPGAMVIFELIDMGKEFLTINNRPASECPICLLSFHQCDTFFRSQCFHHFHSYCLGRYLQSVIQVAASGEHLPKDVPGKTCPVCRDVLDDDIDMLKLLESLPPFEESLDIFDGDAILKEWHGKQEELKTLFEKQKQQGGIIDLAEIDKKRLVISSPREVIDSESPPSSSDAGSRTEGDAVVLERNSTVGSGGGHHCPPQLSGRSKSHAKSKSSSMHHGTQNGPPDKHQVVEAKPSEKSQPQEPVVAAKTSPTLGRHVPFGSHGFKHSGRGKGGSGNTRRRFK